VSDWIVALSGAYRRRLLRVVMVQLEMGMQPSAGDGLSRGDTPARGSGNTPNLSVNWLVPQPGRV
jgi:hypothetical protein